MFLLTGEWCRARASLPWCNWALCQQRICRYRVLCISVVGVVALTFARQHDRVAVVFDLVPVRRKQSSIPAGKSSNLSRCVCGATVAFDA